MAVSGITGTGISKFSLFSLLADVAVFDRYHAFYDSHAKHSKWDSGALLCFRIEHLRSLSNEQQLFMSRMVMRTTRIQELSHYVNSTLLCFTSIRWAALFRSNLSSAVGCPSLFNYHKLSIIMLIWRKPIPNFRHFCGVPLITYYCHCFSFMLMYVYESSRNVRV